MSFVALTEHETTSGHNGRITYIRANCIDQITAVDHPDEGAYTELRYAHTLIHVIETPEEVMQRITMNS